MIFKSEYTIIHCKDEYYKTFDMLNTKSTTYVIKDAKNRFYYRGYIIHRDNGPAIEYSTGLKLWYLNGKHYSEQEYWNIISLKKKIDILNDI